ncbi:MAG: hypothetical protein COT18_01180 [Elusimicrobia bacterium CG08_land_8_20_14_0_20_59_10]|nr:MAG: hypothetical protein COT18_01180 [Elusimicrobia bacterium CG08_land_8_20_14_0_20_59_10]
MRTKTTFTALTAAFLLLGLAGPSCAEDYDARLSTFTGSVDVLAAGETDSWREAEADMPLEAGDKVRTAQDSSAELTLDGGGLLRLGENSSTELSSLKTGSSSFFLRAGSLVAKIKGLLKAGQRFGVRTPAAVCAIRGTEFGVEHDEEGGETTAGVFDEGSLSVSSLDGDGAPIAEEMVEKGDEVNLRAGQRKFKPARMRRLIRHRKVLLAARGRLAKLGKNWKRLPQGKRQELRERFMQRKAFQGRRVKKVRAARGRGAAGAGKGAAAPKPSGDRAKKVKKRAAARRALKGRRGANK